jgi:hypothetical protein
MKAADALDRPEVRPVSCEGDPGAARTADGRVVDALGEEPELDPRV